MRASIRRVLWVMAWLLVGVVIAQLLSGCSANPRTWFHWEPAPMGPPAPPTKDHGPDVETRWLLFVNTLVACACVIATPLCIGLAIWLRSVMFATLALASVGMLIATMATKWVLVHTTAMLWCVLGIVVLAGAGLLFHLWRNRLGFFGAVKVAEALKPPKEFADAKEKRKALQASVAGRASKVIDEARVRLGLKQPDA